MTQGPRAADYHGREVVRHFGDPAAEYRAATSSLAVFDRSHRGRLGVAGRAPGQMLDGILTGTLPGPPTWVRPDEGVIGGRSTYHAVLTPKGKTITDLWAVRRGAEDGPGYLLDVPVAGVEPLKAHLARFLPPRMAKVTDASGETAMATVVGPEAAERLSPLALGLRVEAAELGELAEGEWRVGASPAAQPPPVSDAVLVIRTEDVWPEAFTLLGPRGAVDAVVRALLSAGAARAGLDTWHALRIEAGRPAFGTDMDEGTIPVEAGIHDRAIDYGKGCYTGQEVIVRIRDRGKVNRTLRQLRLGDAEPPAPGTELFRRGDDGGPSGKPIGWITSSVRSPRFGETVALGYVRREVEDDEVVPGAPGG